MSEPGAATGREVRVGVGVILLSRGRVLLGQRLGAHGAGTWALPGGNLDFGESLASCARREVLEETGLVVEGVSHAAFTDDYFDHEGEHYVTLFVQAERWSGEPQNLEPDKCAGWRWFDWHRLPEPLFLPLANLVAQGFVPS